MAVVRQLVGTTTHTFGGWGVCNVGVGEQCSPRGSAAVWVGGVVGRGCFAPTNGVE